MLCHSQGPRNVNYAMLAFTNISNILQCCHRNILVNQLGRDMITIDVQTMENSENTL